jgi:hypothetical protein
LYAIINKVNEGCDVILSKLYILTKLDDEGNKRKFDIEWA